MGFGQDKKNKRIYGLRNLSLALDEITKPVFQKKGFTENKIITDWHLIVGAEIARFSFPKKIYFRGENRDGGVLHVEVWDSGIANDIMYMEPIIVEKIAKYFGYKSIDKIKILQNPSVLKKEDSTIAVIDKDIINQAEKHMHNKLDDIDDPELKKALESLGKSVFIEEHK